MVMPMKTPARLHRTPGLATVVATLLALGPQPVALRGDTIHLKNGYRFDGKVDEELSTDRRLVIRIGDSGWVRLGRDRVERVETNSSDGTSNAATAPGPVPAIAAEMVTLHLVDDLYLGSGREPRGGISGTLEPTVERDHYVVEIPGTGTMWIPREFVKSVEAYRPEQELAPVAADLRAIPTSHLVELKNGRRIRGSVRAGEAVGTVVVDIGTLGRLFIDRKRIEKIDEVQGEFELPPPAPTGPTPEPPAPETGDGQAQAAEPVDAKQPATVDVVHEIDPRLEEEIYELVYELNRERTRNRVRAESKLRELGPVVVPYLGAAVHSPFDLTRRAALRIIRDVGNPDGLPLVIEALTDQDVFVRRHAFEALRRLWTGDLPYTSAAAAARASGRRLREFQQRIEQRYEEALAMQYGE